LSIHGPFGAACLWGGCANTPATSTLKNSAQTAHQRQIPNAVDLDEVMVSLTVDECGNPEEGHDILHAVGGHSGRHACRLTRTPSRRRSK
jgi:hypothetical protein